MELLRLLRPIVWAARICQELLDLVQLLVHEVILAQVFGQNSVSVPVECAEALFFQWDLAPPLRQGRYLKSLDLNVSLHY